MMELLCSEEGCSTPSRTRGMCAAHNVRAYYAFLDGKSDKRFSDYRVVVPLVGSSREYAAWQNMKKRCNNESNKDYHNYGGRGISVCRGFSDSYKEFMKLVGEKPTSKHSLDRVDNSLSYSCGQCEQCVKMGWPLNCRWATSMEQNNNKRGILTFVYEGKSYTLTQLADCTGMNRHTLRNRLVKFGWSVDKAIGRPLHCRSM